MMPRGNLNPQPLDFTTGGRSLPELLLVPGVSGDEIERTLRSRELIAEQSDRGRFPEGSDGEAVRVTLAPTGRV
jgi:hypothetical protein